MSNTSPDHIHILKVPIFVARLIQLTTHGQGLIFVQSFLFPVQRRCTASREQVSQGQRRWGGGRAVAELILLMVARGGGVMVELNKKRIVTFYLATHI